MKFNILEFEPESKLTAVLYTIFLVILWAAIIFGALFCIGLIGITLFYNYMWISTGDANIGVSALMLDMVCIMFTVKIYTGN